MIRADDFDIEIRNSSRGTSIRITHKPTGNHRVVDPVAEGAVGKTRDRLIAELRREMFRDEDIRIDYGRAEGGDFMRVVHTPSGIERWAMRREGRTTDELLDEVLEELHVRTSETQRGG